MGGVTSDISHNMAVLHNIVQIYKATGLDKDAEVYENEMKLYNSIYSRR